MMAPREPLSKFPPTPFRGLAGLWAALLGLTFPASGQIQLTPNTLTFPPTTIDSLAEMSVTVTNDLAVEQSVTFSGLSAPFSTPTNPIAIPAEGSTTTTFSFNPVSVNSFESVVVATGSAFGADTLEIFGEGTLPGAVLLADTLDFGAVSVNSVATAYIPVASTGLGTLYLSELTASSPEIYLDEGVSILQGDTALVPIRFFSELSGVYNIDATLYTSDPFNPTLDFHCTISAISEVGGEVCGTWSLVNSPYQLVDDVVVPESCSLIIEPGVVVLGDQFDIEVFGGFYVNGEPGNEVEITCGELLSHTTADQMVLTHSVITETNEVEFSDYDYRILRDENPYSFDSLAQWFDYPYFDVTELYYNENWWNHFGRYFEDFEDNSCQGWSQTLDSWPCGYQISSSCNGDNYNRVRDNCSSGYSGWVRTLSPNFDLGNHQQPASVSFYMDTYNHYWGYNSNYVDYNIAYRVDGGSWVNLEASDSYLEAAYKSFDLSSIGVVGAIQFRMSAYFQYDGAITIDDFDFRTNLYPGYDDDSGFLHDESNDAYLGAIVHTLSTGSFALNHSTFRGDFHGVGDSIQILLSNSIIEKNGEREKNSHGLGLYADHVEISIENSTISNHNLEGLHVEANSVQQSSLNSNIQGNGANGIEVIGDFNLTSDSTTIANNGATGLGITGSLSLTSDHLTIQDNGSNGLDVSQSLDWQSSFDVVANNGDDGITVGSTLTLDADSLEVHGNNANGIIAAGSNSDVTLYQSQLHNNSGDGIRLSGGSSALDIDYSFIRDNGGDGIDMGGSNVLELDNSLVGYNGGQGIRSYGSVDINYSNILHNGGVGISTSLFSTVDNSIVWFNGGVPQMTTTNSFAVSYTNVQGINALLTNSQFAWGDGCIGTDPVLTDDNGHLDPYSPCVDGGMPWEQDAHIPMGLGSSRADMGMYGGPQNAFWGGQAPPDGSVVITDVFDIPGDQGGELGIQFTASPFDFGGLGFNVTHYSIWRDLQVASDSLVDVANGNWEQIGTVPAQGFNQYGFTAETLVNSNPGNPACMTNFIVLAHTTDENIYWVSAVAGACAVDNLAPAEPELNGMVVEDTDLAAQIHWPSPPEPDYAYTEVSSDAGFEATLNDDTLVVDNGLIAGLTYTYTVQHFDINGNASPPATLSLTAESGSDRIPLNAGWNLVSSDRAPGPAGISGIAASLEPGNLAYITGFDGGVEFYDPSGWDFLNTMDEWTAGRGYWVKVSEPDTLEIAGTPLPEDFLPSLAAGWNLVAYPGVQPAAPSAFFADLIEADNLVYVTGFDGGSRFFDPNGLPFLNTLTALEDGLGYWVKVLEGSDEQGGNAPVLDNPMGLVMNGLSNLPAGETVQIVDGAGSVVAELPVLPGGHLMTTGISLDGLETELCFEWKGEVADHCIAYSGGTMEVKHLDLNFETARQPLSAMPNPFQGGTLRLELAVAEPGDVHFELLDAAGRVLAERVMSASSIGEQVLEWPLGTVAPGLYTCRATGERGLLGTTSILSVD